jgi:hypothetical protein
MFIHELIALCCWIKNLYYQNTTLATQDLYDRKSVQYESRFYKFYPEVLVCTLCAEHIKTIDYCSYSVYRVQIGSGAHPASYTMGTRSSFPGGKAAGA